MTEKKGEPSPYRIIHDGEFAYKARATTRIGERSIPHTIPSTCHLTVWEKDTHSIVLATEIKENEGMSVTNGMEHLAEEAVKRFHLNPKSTIFVERYNADSYNTRLDEETYTLVLLGWVGNFVSSVSWIHIEKEDFDNYFIPRP